MSCSKCDFNNSLRELNRCKNPICNTDDPFYKKVVCFQRSRKGLNVDDRLGYIINQYNPIYDITALKKIYNEYPYKKC